jgi:hypothetical protein
MPKDSRSTLRPHWIRWRLRNGEGGKLGPFHRQMKSEEAAEAGVRVTPTHRRR